MVCLGKGQQARLSPAVNATGCRDAALTKWDLPLPCLSLEDCSLGKGRVCIRSYSQEFPHCGASPEKNLFPKKYMQTQAVRAVSGQYCPTGLSLREDSFLPGESPGQLTTAVQRRTTLEEGDFFVTRDGSRNEHQGFSKI